MNRLAIALLTVILTSPAAVARTVCVTVTADSGNTGWGAITTTCVPVDRPRDPRAGRLR